MIDQPSSVPESTPPPQKTVSLAEFTKAALQIAERANREMPYLHMQPVKTETVTP